MAQPKKAVRVVVVLAFAEASVLARAAVTVTSALDCREVNAAEAGLRTFRSAVALAISRSSSEVVVDHTEANEKQPRRAS
ncbi:hypothetical protein JNUCC0626_48675 [Lentzea sp. JNUCC 0626]|uniref:hypothetical protein n=1 Tax=Lentzea sp. JNUCC 0626 TaxID=3367513 RepID=UPI003749E600